MSKKYLRLLDEKGVSLSLLGLEEFALTREDALTAVETLRHDSVAILGGDVYLLRGARVELAYANWSAEDDSTKTSWDIAFQYIMRFPERSDATPVFAFVTGQHF
jgi:hypothetical protein